MPIYLSIYLPTHLPTYMYTCMHACMDSNKIKTTAATPAENSRLRCLLAVPHTIHRHMTLLMLTHSRTTIKTETTTAPGSCSHRQSASACASCNAGSSDCDGSVPARTSCRGGVSAGVHGFSNASPRSHREVLPLSSWPNVRVCVCVCVCTYK